MAQDHSLLTWSWVIKLHVYMCECHPMCLALWSDGLWQWSGMHNLCRVNASMSESQTANKSWKILQYCLEIVLNNRILHGKDKAVMAETKAVTFCVFRHFVSWSFISFPYAHTVLSEHPNQSVQVHEIGFAWHFCLKTMAADVINVYYALPSVETMHEIQSQVIIGEAFNIPGVNGDALWLSACNQITWDRC